MDVEGLVDQKVEVLRAHVSQVLKNGLVDLEAIEALARYRGFQARIRNAEAFETERFVWDLKGSGTHDQTALEVAIDLALQEASA